jgi:hypothetical protein
MTKTLIAIVSCSRDTLNGFNDAIRQTWLKDNYSDYAFILGRDAVPTHSDEVVVNSKDDYLSLPEKTHALLTWALGKDYDYIFKCDTDTFAMPKRILTSGYTNHDYIGYFNGPVGQANVVYKRCFAWASGGSGYWLSKKAAQIIVDNPPDKRAICPILKYPCEDLWVGQLLGKQISEHRFTGLHDDRYWRGFRGDFKVEFTSHYCSEGMNRKFNTNWMYKHYEVNK